MLLEVGNRSLVARHDDWYLPVVGLAVDHELEAQRPVLDDVGRVVGAGEDEVAWLRYWLTVAQNIVRVGGIVPAS